jgi:hypothetical protein
LYFPYYLNSIWKPISFNTVSNYEVRPLKKKNKRSRHEFFDFIDGIGLIIEVIFKGAFRLIRHIFD